MNIPTPRATALLALLALTTLASPADACRYVRPWAELRDAWAATSKFAGTVLARDAVFKGTSCEDATDLALRSRMAATITASGIVLLGEVHDNAAHHTLRAAMIETIIADTAKKPALVFEHIRADQKDALDALNGRPFTRAELMTALDWGREGWGDAELFAPLFDIAIKHGLAILPGSPPRTTVRDLARGGALDAAEQQRLGLDKAFPDVLQTDLLRELEGAHCGLMPKTAFGGMAFAQRYRDAHMAAAADTAVRTHGGAVILAGNGHVRSDRGVPYYLLTSRPRLSVMPLEISAGQSADLPTAFKTELQTADFLLVTPRAERKDPCEGMRAQFGKKK